MVGLEFLEQVSKLQVASYVGVEDFADKFNFLITVMVIGLCTTTVTVKQYMMKPISCYMATDIGGRNLLDYVENYCWVQGTIPIAYSSRIPDDEKSWHELNTKKLLYYQWVPFVLGLQCILFYLPRLIWQMICYNRSGTDVQHLVTSASQAVHSNEEQRNKLVKHLAKTLEQMLFQQHRKRLILQDRARQREAGACSQVSTFNLDNIYEDDYPFKKTLKQRLLCCFKGKLTRFQMRFGAGSQNGILITTLYYFVKILYLTNSIGQLFLMQSFLGVSLLEVIHNITQGYDWEQTLLFPRVGFCVTPMRAIGARANFATAQCVLPGNLWNEKVFVFLCIWITLVCAINIWSFLQTTMGLIYTRPDQDMLRNWLRISEVYEESMEPKFLEFSRQFFRHDGLFVARVLKQNAGEVLANEVISNLWQNYLERDNDPLICSKTNRKISTTTALTEKQLAALVNTLKPSAPSINSDFNNNNSNCRTISSSSPVPYNTDYI